MAINDDDVESLLVNSPVCVVCGNHNPHYTGEQSNQIIDRNNHCACEELEQRKGWYEHMRGCFEPAMDISVIGVLTDFNRWKVWETDVADRAETFTCHRVGNEVSGALHNSYLVPTQLQEIWNILLHRLLTNLREAHILFSSNDISE
jgi:hypothetical protein